MLHKISTICIPVNPFTYEVFMVRKAEGKTFAGKWIAPGGKIDPEEIGTSGVIFDVAENSVRREVLEETGLVVPELYYLTSLVYDVAEKGRGLNFSYWGFVRDPKSVKLQEEEIAEGRFMSVAEAKSLDLVDGMLEELVAFEYVFEYVELDGMCYASAGILDIITKRMIKQMSKYYGGLH